MKPVRSSEPVFILVRPQLGENIGKAARAMLNFGFTRMRLISPRDGWPNPSAGPAAAGADIVLEQAEIFATTADALADCNHVYATTVRKRGVTKPVITPEQAARLMTHSNAIGSAGDNAATGQSAILFGPERSGLETDDVAMAQNIITVPINPQFGSLNLAQAVILMAYELSKCADQTRYASPPSDTPILPPAPQDELNGLFETLISMLEPKSYFHPPDRTVATKRALRNILTKPQWDTNEVRTLRGVLSTLAKTRRPD